MLINLPTFNGISPRTTPRLLKDTFAQIARDVKLWNGTLRPWRAPVQVAALDKVGIELTIYRFGQTEPGDSQYWFHWTTDVDVVRIPAASGERTVFSGDGPPKVTDAVLALSGGGSLPNAAWTLGVPSPTTAPGASVTGSAGSGEQIVERFYVYTFVNNLGEEGGVSPVSNVLAAYASQDVTLSGLEVPSGAQGFTSKRIYETQGVGESADFYLVAEVAAGASGATFPADSANRPNPAGTVAAIGSKLRTADFFPPPASLFCLRRAPGTGLLAGLAEGKLRFCEPNYPYAWPPKYEYPFDFDPVAIGVYGTTIVVGTRGTPYLVQGIDPGNMQVLPLEHQYACVSKRSMIAIAGGVIYASPDGLVQVDNSGARLITAEHYDRDQWQALNPAAMHGVWWDNRVVMFYDAGGSNRGAIIMDPGREPSVIPLYASAAWVDPQRDAMYLAIDNAVLRFDAGAAQSFLWRSKIFRTPRRLNFGYYRASVSGPVTMRLYGDGVLRATRALATDVIRALPAGYTAQEWEFEFEGTGELRSLQIAETIDELKQGPA
ncbi:MAG: hypothetical protein ACK5XA_15755 [Tagaea sp.]